MHANTPSLSWLAGAALLLAVGIPGLLQANEMRELVNEDASIFHEKQASGKPIPTEILKRASGIGIIEVTKGAAGIGGAYGEGIIIARVGKGWSAPFAFTQGGGSVGVQLGVDIKRYVYVFNSEKAMRSFTSSDKANFEAVAKATAGPDHYTETADNGLPSCPCYLYVYALSEGAFAGASVGGQLVGNSNETNVNAYGTDNPDTILGGRVPQPPYSQWLYKSLNAAMNAATSK